MPTPFRRFKWRTSNSCRSCVTPQTWLIRHQSVVHEREGQGPWTFLLDVVGIFPNEDAIVRIFGLLMLEQNDEWAFHRAHHIRLESVGQLSDDPLISMLAVAR